jgi:hypothetical protein
MISAFKHTQQHESWMLNSHKNNRCRRQPKADQALCSCGRIKAESADLKNKSERPNLALGRCLYSRGLTKIEDREERQRVEESDSKKIGVNRCCARSYHTRKLELQKEPRIREKSWQQLGLTCRQSSKQNRTLVQGMK